ncbi:MAG TPA: nucleoside deaminase [Candidatus Limnocylindrales bacterium]|nr:nucleoside deaminase [Candidatus Limnocylindrales bacterium]
MDERDMDFLRRAIGLAGTARAAGNHPFGSLVVAADGRVLIEAGNTVSVDGPTGHAETNAVRAVAAVDRDMLRGATLYASTEPCAMCAGAIYWSGIGRVVYALGEDALRSLTGDDPANPTMALPCREVFARGQRPTTVEGPALEDEARAVHRGFWHA